MEYYSLYIQPLLAENEENVYLIGSVFLMLMVIFFMYKTYRASINVEARLAEFSSLTNNVFANRMQLIEVSANEYKLNKKALGPLAKIIDAYAVLATDRAGVITYANEKFLALSEFALQDLIGKPQSIHHTDFHDETFWQGMRGSLAEDKAWHGELCSKSSSGNIYWMDVFIFPLSYVTDSDDGYIWFGTDITGIKTQNSQLLREVKKKDEAISKVESMLLHSEKMASLGTISAGIAHEINNPIAYITSNISRFQKYIGAFAEVVKAIRERVPAEQLDRLVATRRGMQLSVKEIDFMLGDYPSLVEDTADGIDRIRKIISDLKCFSHERAEAYKPIDVHKCIDTSLNLARHETRHKVTIRKKFADAAPAVRGSESQLSQVFVNLFVNAAQAIEGRGEIEIETRATQSGFLISIRDTGPGIPPETLDNIFEPFFTTKPVGKGTGLGLSISQDIIKRHGGTIGVQSTQGKGTTFTIELPLSAQRSSHAA